MQRNNGIVFDEVLPLILNYSQTHIYRIRRIPPWIRKIMVKETEVVGAKVSNETFDDRDWNN